MSYIIIRMPDGTYAKIPADSAPPTPSPPPVQPPPTGDWVTRPEFQQVISELRAKDEDLQSQIDELRSQLEEGLPSGEIAERLERLEQEQKQIRQLIESIEQDGQLAERVRVLEDKQLLIAIRERTPGILNTNVYQLRYSGGTIEPGYITVLNADGSAPAFTSSGEPIYATLDATGRVTLSHVPNQQVTFIFGAKVSFASLPENAFQEHFVTELERKTQLILDVDRIDRELEIQEITPSALSAAAMGDQVYLSWAYKDSPKLSHFIVEVFDERTGQWVPFDGASGVVPK